MQAFRCWVRNKHSCSCPGFQLRQQ
ncbi:SWIM zinc finger family protein [Xenorhabdus bovienii]|nr:SWIM zinc finger family protein [Xenorhabdus bovienii]